MAPADDFRPHFGVSLQGQSAGEKSSLDVVLVHHIHDSPHADSAAVLEKRLVGQVPLAGRHVGGRFSGGFAVGVAVQKGVL